MSNKGHSISFNRVSLIAALQMLEFKVVINSYINPDNYFFQLEKEDGFNSIRVILNNHENMKVHLVIYYEQTRYEFTNFKNVYKKIDTILTRIGDKNAISNNIRHGI